MPQEMPWIVLMAPHHKGVMSTGRRHAYVVVGVMPPPINKPSKLISFAVCDGLRHRYERVAA